MVWEIFKSSLAEAPGWFLPLAFSCMFLAFGGCTVAIIMNHTHGYANDLVDETQDVSPDVEIPLKGV